MIANNVYQTDEKYQEEDMIILCIVVWLVWNVGVMEFMSILRHWFITRCISWNIYLYSQPKMTTKSPKRILNNGLGDIRYVYK